MLFLNVHANTARSGGGGRTVAGDGGARADRVSRTRDAQRERQERIMRTALNRTRDTNRTRG